MSHVRDFFVFGNSKFTAQIYTYIYIYIYTISLRIQGTLRNLI